MFNFASWPGRPEERRAHTEHTQSTHRQSTHRAHTEHTQSTHRAHTEHTQNTHRAHTEHTQSTHRARTEPSQSTHRAHTEPTQSTHRAHTENTQSAHRGGASPCPVCPLCFLGFIMSYVACPHLFLESLNGDLRHFPVGFATTGKYRCVIQNLEEGPPSELPVVKKRPTTTKSRYFDCKTHGPHKV